MVCIITPKSKSNQIEKKQTASKFGRISLNDTLLTRPDSRQNLCEIYSRVIADIEAQFLQVKVPPKDTVYEYERLIFGAKSSPNCAYYALQQVAKDNAQVSPQIAKLISRDY